MEIMLYNIYKISVTIAYFLVSLLTPSTVYVPDLDIEVGVTDCTDAETQYYVDAPNVAAGWSYYDYSDTWPNTYDDTYIIADHNYQAFANLHNAQPGMQLFYKGNIFTCNSKAKAYAYYKDGLPSLYYSNGSPALYGQDLVLYTCTGTGNERWVTTWQNTTTPRSS